MQGRRSARQRELERHERELAAASFVASAPDEKCPICTEPFTNESKLSDCVHRFCNSCILTWTRINSACPLCKQDISYLITKDGETVIVPSKDARRENAESSSSSSSSAQSSPRRPLRIAPRRPWNMRQIDEFEIDWTSSEEHDDLSDSSGSARRESTTSRILGDHVELASDDDDDETSVSSGSFVESDPTSSDSSIEILTKRSKTEPAAASTRPQTRTSH